MLIPIAITAATLGTMYYTRKPVNELRQGRSYRIGVNVDGALFQGAANAPAVANVIQDFLTTAGFSPVRFRSSRAASPNITTFWYDGTWTRPETYITTPAVPGVNAAFYEKLPLL